MTEQVVQLTSTSEDQDYQTWLKSLKAGERVVVRAYYLGEQDTPDGIETVQAITPDGKTVLEYGTTLNQDGETPDLNERDTRNAYLKIFPLTAEIEKAVQRNTTAYLIDGLSLEHWLNCPLDYLEQVLWNVKRYHTISEEK